MDETSPPKRSKTKLIIIWIQAVIILLLIGLFVWCWLKDDKDAAPASPSGGGGAAGATGPCTAGAENIAPAGYTFYENTTLGYRFAYPTSWGTVSVTTTPIASESGDYVMGKFSANDKVWFGGNATDYIVKGRDGIPTDLPGYLKASGKFYTVELWRFTDGTTTENRHDIHPLEPPFEEKPACNTTALVTHIPVSEISSVGPADVARFTLQPTNHYYGVNIVLDKPDSTASAQLENVIKTFQLIP